MENQPLVMDEILATFNVIVINKAQQYPLPTCIELLSYIKTFQWYAVASEVELKDMWNTIRGDVYCTDFIANLTVDLQIQLTVNSTIEFSKLATIIGQSFDNLHRNNSNYTVSDEDFINRIPDGGMKSYFINNDWLVTCYLLSRVDLRPVIALMNQMKPTNNENKS